jgi:hypothetical protein
LLSVLLCNMRMHIPPSLHPVQHWFRKLRLCEPQLIEFIVDVIKTSKTVNRHTF